MQSSYLNADMGLFLKFSTDEATGRPIGCSGFTKPNWLANKVRLSRPHNCPLNDAMDDDSGLKMHEIVEAFAKDNQAWVDEFVPVFQKMQENGYASDTLTAAPNNWQGLHSNNHKCRPL